MKFMSFLVVAAIAASATTLAIAADPPSSVTVKLAAQNDSGETGTAVLTQGSDGVKVVVSITGAPAGVAQPTHIHEGTCAKLNPAPKYPLSNTVDGKGTSTVKDVKLADLLAGKYAINIHKSGTDIATYVSCGDIVAPAM